MLDLSLAKLDHHGASGEYQGAYTPILGSETSMGQRTLTIKSCHI